MALLERFGSVVGRLRVARDLSQEKLAHLSGLHATTISAVERGKTSVTLETLEALAHGLNIEPGDLVTMAAADDLLPDAPKHGSMARKAGYGVGPRQFRFSIVAERTSAGYAAYCPDLPGCAATGESPDEVQHAMRKAITAELQSRRRAGDPIPEPATYIAVISVTL
jgi:transcriptional regulator with XRE-family HTH domain